MPPVPKRPVLADQGAQAGSWSGTLANLAGWLCDAAYPDGSKVGQVQLQLRRDGTIIRATLKIEDQGGLRMTGVGETPEEALEALDALLVSDLPPWEGDPYPLGGKIGKKK